MSHTIFYTQYWDKKIFCATDLDANQGKLLEKRYVPCIAFP